MRFILNPLLFLQAAILICLQASGQKDRPDIKFGNVKVADFSPKYYSVDSSASAVYLFDVGSSHYEGNTKGYFSVIYERHARIRLLKKSAFDDIASVKIELYATDDFKQEVDDIQAATYNLENGQIITTKVDKKAIFKDKDGKWIIKKFTFPNIKEGSIIEFTYQITSPSYRYLFPWYFQDEYPRLWTEYSVEVPVLFDFVFLKQGYLPFNIDNVKIDNKNYVIAEQTTNGYANSQRYTVSATTTNHTWAIKNVVPLKEENYTTTLHNYVSKIEFQISAIHNPNEPVDSIMHNWNQASKELMKDDDFAKQLSDDNDFLENDIKAATAGKTNDFSRAKAIYDFVRNNYLCNEHSGLYLSKNLYKIYKEKNGNVTDINMLLTAMLKKAGMQAFPVILSTRSHGLADNNYPILDKYNYTISQVKTADGDYLLDATDSYLDFGRLPGRCYNGFARVVSEDNPVSINLSADLLKETNITSLIIINENDSVAGTYVSTVGNMQSHSLRESLTTNSKIHDYFNDIKKDYLFEVGIKNAFIDSLKNFDSPVTIKYDFNFKPTSDLIYFNPLLNQALKENPFKSTERLYPVEMPSCQDNTFVLNMEIPKGYKVDEIPKSAKVMLNADDGFFEYVIRTDKERIQLRCRTFIKKATFLPEDYQTLRDFFAFIVKKEAEQIVFKKL